MKKIKKLFSLVILALFIFDFFNVPLVVNAATLYAPTSVKAVSSSYNSIKISWNGVTGAVGYEVYRATSSTGTYSLISRTTAKSYNNTGLTTGKTYYYKVRANKTSGTTRVYGSFSYKVSAKPVPSVPTSVKAVSSSYNSINVSWGAVTGASGYEVYRATSSTGTYTLVSRTTARNYNNTGLTTGRTYYYKVRAYRTVGTTRIYGSYSSKVSAKPVPSVPTSVKAASFSYNSVKISWNAVTGASGYEVYRAASSTGTYTFITRGTATSYNNTGLTTGTSYYYKVRAYRTVGTTRIYGGYSSIVSSKPIPSTPTSVKAVSSSYNSIDVSWSAVTGASGYEVYRAAAAAGTYTLVSSSTATNFTNKGLLAATTYYYKVRAYRTMGSVKVYSNYSSAVSGTTAAVNVTSISLDKTTSDLLVGETDNLTATIAPENSTNKTIKWTSSDNTVVTVDGTGKLTAIKAGEATVTATTVDGGKTSSCVVTVTSPIVNVQSVSLNKASSSLILGNTDILIATIGPSNATNQSVAWTTSDSTIATVDNTGKVTPLKAGTVTITVATEDGSKTASCTLTVSNANIKGIDVSKWQYTINWSSVKSDGVKFAMIRSSYGDGTDGYKNNGVDPMFETNYTGAKNNGIAVGAYHYSYATTVAEATAEANFFVSRLKGKQFEYPICVDIEDESQASLDAKTLTDISLVYLNTIKNAGYYPIIYANKYWFTSKLDDTRLAPYDHWLAQWSSSITYTGKVGIWQYTSSGTVNGISGSVDMNTSFVDYEAKIKALHLNGF
jgi:uncharacterized protein YjdB